MKWEEQYQRWLLHKELDEDLKVELEELRGHQGFLEDAFYKSLEFGTGGMRGELGPGTNRMNKYTVRKAAKGLAQLISEKGDAAKQKGVAISYDNRRYSKEFALESARVLGTDGIRVYVFEELRPTPQLSFAVRKLDTAAGIMITASHNPPEYNGFKVYGEDGAQLAGADSDELLRRVNEIKDELSIDIKEVNELEEEGRLSYLGAEMDEAYEEELLDVIQDRELVNNNGGDLSIVFTPLHGASKVPVVNSFNKAGYSKLHVVASQAEPDSSFSNVSSANPEEHVAFDLAIKEGLKTDADILIATDPDGDRVGVAAKNKSGVYEVLNGNQTGALMLHYLLSAGKEKAILPENGVMVQTIVTSPLGKAIAESFNIESVDVLTGFKYIAEKIRGYEKDNSKSFLFGYEESYGYLIKPFVRDKDAIQAALLASETAMHYKQQGKTLFEALDGLYEEYGYYRETLHSFIFKGKEGTETMKNFLDTFRKSPLELNDGFQLERVEDYLEETVYDKRTGTEKPTGLPKSNVLKYVMTDGSWFCLRPSGTEPKLKLYFGVKGETEEDAENKLKVIVEPLLKKIQEHQS